MSDSSENPSPESLSLRLSADIGGTFTDIVLLSPTGRYWTKKVSSTPDDFATGVIEGMELLLDEESLLPSYLAEIIHGTTVATNAVLENKGAKTALLTTRGFRDVLEFRRLRVPQLYNAFYRPPEPLVERRLRLEVDERIGAGGSVVRRLDEESLKPAMDRLREHEPEAVAVCLIHSYSNPEHERRVGQLVQEGLPDAFISLSVDVLPEIREYERTSTTVINAYLGPIVKNYLDSLVRQLRESGADSAVRIMQSNGGLMSAARAAEAPVHILESGPAAGVVAAHEMGKRIGQDRVIAFDMGGTTAKASLIEDGQRSWTTEYEVGAGISLSSRLVKGGGYAVKVPVLDLAEVGAGGGSIVWIDRGGALRVGPQSAGAIPGPVCYDFGGKDPTVTDANLVLGYINPTHLVGGSVELRGNLAVESIQENVADRLGLSLFDAAYGVHTVANVSMIRAIRAVSTYRGRDPRDFALLAFGGSGPIHAVGIARSLGISHVVIPPSPGVFSAIGLLEAQPEHHFVQTFVRRISDVDTASINETYVRLQERGSDTLLREGYVPSDITWQRLADLRFVGQAYELTVPAAGHDLGPEDIADLDRAFQIEHERTYGYRPDDEPVELVNLRVTARGKSDQRRPEYPYSQDTQSTEGSRKAYFGSDYGTIETAIITRSDIGSDTRHGPFIIEEYDATVVVPPECVARLDEWNNVVIDDLIG